MWSNKEVGGTPFCGAIPYDECGIATMLPASVYCASVFPWLDQYNSFCCPGPLHGHAVGNNGIDYACQMCSYLLRDTILATCAILMSEIFKVQQLFYIF